MKIEKFKMRRTKFIVKYPDNFPIDEEEAVKVATLKITFYDSDNNVVKEKTIEDEQYEGGSYLDKLHQDSRYVFDEFDDDIDIAKIVYTISDFQLNDENQAQKSIKVNIRKSSRSSGNAIYDGLRRRIKQALQKMEDSGFNGPAPIFTTGIDMALSEVSGELPESLSFDLEGRLSDAQNHLNEAYIEIEAMKKIIEKYRG